MPARRMTTVMIPVDATTTAQLRVYRNRTPMLAVVGSRSPLVMTLTLPDNLRPGHLRFARELAAAAAQYAAEVERAYRGLAPVHGCGKAA
jgi:hypothetical protein